MARYVVSRLASSVVVVFVVAAIVFGLTAISAGDPALIFAGDNASEADLAAVRERMGLDRPLAVRFFSWATEIASGNLGQSLFTGRPVLALIGQRVQPTVVLALATILFSLLMAIPIGTIAALKPDSSFDRAVMSVSSLAFATPGFIVGYILVYVFALRLGWLPVQGYRPLSAGLGGTLQSIALPCLTLSFVYIALLARTTRAALIEVLSQDFIRSAKARGAGTARLVIHHALRNATNSISTVVGLGIASMLGGVTIVETVFGIPGLGRLTVDGILNRDFPVIQALILLSASVKIVVNLLIDLSYPFVDPRIQL